MAIDEFSNCVGDKVRSDAHEVAQLGDEGWKKLIEFWNQTPDWLKLYLTWVAGANKERLAKAFIALVGLEAWEAVLVLLSAATLFDLMQAAVQCQAVL
jgi:hypothetical protein